MRSTWRRSWSCRRSAISSTAAAIVGRAAWARTGRPASRVATSLDRPLAGGEGATLGELVAAPGGDVGEELNITLSAEAVRRIVDEMPEPEREVIRLRYGIDGDAQPQTYAAIGGRL